MRREEGLGMRGEWVMLLVLLAKHWERVEGEGIGKHGQA